MWCHKPRLAHQLVAFRYGAAAFLRVYSTGRSGSSDGACAEMKQNAYQVLGLSPNCDVISVRAAFRRLARATHPDMQSGSNRLNTTARFIAVLAAYKILSDPQKRAQYDAYLTLRSNSSTPTSFDSGTQGNSDGRGKVNGDNVQGIEFGEIEVVEWLKWYRQMVVEAVNKKEIGVGEGFQEYLRGELHAALKVAYFGPYANEIDTLPDCFEAEIRTDCGVPDILHLVSGRQLFGLVRQECEGVKVLTEGQKILLGKTKLDKLMNDCSAKKCFINERVADKISTLDDLSRKESQLEVGFRYSMDTDLTAYASLELHLFGKLVAKATRTPPNISYGSLKDRCDQISIYLCRESSVSSLDDEERVFTSNLCSSDSSGLDKTRPELLGTIYGLSTSVSGGKCTVCAPNGKETHVILQYRTPLVKHMNWFRISDEIAQCECICRQAWLPSSKFWLFEPRCNNHNVGAWNIETFGHGKRFGMANSDGKWRSLNNHYSDKDCSDTSGWAGKSMGLLHPAMYIIATAYKTLDAEVEQRRKKSLISLITGQLNLHAAASGVFVWCKEKLPFLRRL